MPVLAINSLARHRAAQYNGASTCRQEIEMRFTATLIPAMELT
jgi:hypothetical protein